MENICTERSWKDNEMLAFKICEIEQKKVVFWEKCTGLNAYIRKESVK